MFRKLKKLKRQENKYKLAWLQGVCQNGTALPPGDFKKGVTIIDGKYPDAKSEKI